MNKFKKYCPNVWIAECEKKYRKGEIILLETKYGKEVECKVYNLLYKEGGKWYYSITRLENETYAERKVRKYMESVETNLIKSQERLEASNEGKDFLSLAEPIKLGHHSEKAHRALIDRNWRRFEKAMEYDKKAKEQESKAEYWKKKAKEITLAMPESLEYFTFKLEEAKKVHKKLKDNPELRAHSYSLAYAKKDVNKFKDKVEIARKLWGEI